MQRPYPFGFVISACLLAGCGGGSEEPQRPATGHAGAGPPPADAPEALPGLPDEAAERGLDYVNRSGRPGKPTILEANGAGVALLDLGSDGDLDVVFAQGLESLERLLTGPGADLEVYENDGTGRFARVEGPGLAGWWTGLATGDVDGDGDDDLVVGGFGDVAVLLQDDDGRLVPLADAGVAPAARWVVGEPDAAEAPPAWATSLALFDADGDGALDLYVGQYLELDPRDPPLGELGEGELAVPCRWKGHEVYCGPRGLAPQPDRLLRGLGGGRFVDETAARLVDHAAGFTLAVHPFDADGDLDTDLLVANDSSPNLLLVNDGRGVFTDHGFTAGVALSVDGMPEAGMGLASGDVNRDGRPDFALTNFSDEPSALYFGAPFGFANVTHRYGLLRESRHLLSWSTHLADLDADGWLDLYTANGHVYPQADREQTGTSYGQPDSLWHLGPEPKAVPFDDLGPRSALAPALGTRGSALGDLDGDGAPDLVLTRIDGPAALARNRLGPGNRRLALRLVGPAEAGAPGPAGRRTPRDGKGAQAVLVVRGADGAEVGLLAEVQTCVGYQSASTPWLHFGLGASAEYTALQVRWPSGRVEELPGGPAGRRIVVREGAGIVASEPFGPFDGPVTGSGR